jgi:hypothetical protein
MTKPTVIEIIPALVRRVEIGTLYIPKIRKTTTRTATTTEKN